MKENRCFIDTNIFVYAKLDSPDSKDKRDACVKLLQESEGCFVTGTQVLGEISSVMIRSKVDDASIESSLHVINPFQAG